MQCYIVTVTPREHEAIVPSLGLVILIGLICLLFHVPWSSASTSQVLLLTSNMYVQEEKSIKIKDITNVHQHYPNFRSQIYC